jgi:catechol 2,3-dioxygenase-like lactoylglutathione lyase family enzyme
MEQTNSLLQGIDTVIVRVKDIEASKKWYEEKLGLTPVWDDAALKLVVLDTKGPTSLTLWQTAKTISIEKETASYPIFKTPDAAALRQELLNRKVETGDIIEDDHVNYFFFYDPDGNVLEACQVHGQGAGY